jgi:hypothetical protein
MPDSAEVCKILDNLRKMQSCEVEKDCRAGVAVMEQLFDGSQTYPGFRNRLYNADFPNLIVHLGDGGEPPRSGSAPWPATPRLIWKGKHTPYVRGARQIWGLAFLEAGPQEPKKAKDPIAGCEEEPSAAPAGIVVPNAPPLAKVLMRRTVDQWPSTLPSLGFLNPSVPDKGPESPTAAAEEDEVEFQYIGECHEAAAQAAQLMNLGTLPRRLWYGGKGFTLTADTTNRISVYAVPPKDEAESKEDDAKGDGEAVPCCCQQCETLIKEKECAKKRKERDEKEAAHAVPPRLPFLVSRGGFSNSRTGRLGVSLALGATTNVDDTRLSTDGTGGLELAPYVFTKAYVVRPRMKVREVSGHSSGPFKDSDAIVLGTRIGSPFKEFLVGYSRGHVVDRLGIMVGVNFIRGGVEVVQTEVGLTPVELEAFQEVGDARKTRFAEVGKRFESDRKFFFALDYTF